MAAVLAVVLAVAAFLLTRVAAEIAAPAEAPTVDAWASYEQQEAGGPPDLTFRPGHAVRLDGANTLGIAAAPLIRPGSLPHAPCGGTTGCSCWRS